MQSLTFIIFITSEKIATLKFFPHTDLRPDGRLNADHYIDTFFMWFTNTLQLMILTYLSPLNKVIIMKIWKTCQKANVKVCITSENVSIISWFVQKWIIVVYSYIRDLHDSPTKLQLNRITAWNFLLKLSSIAVPLNYGQGHWKWFERIKLNEYHHPKFNIYQVYGVWGNPSV